VRQRSANPALPRWAPLLWGTALLGLFLLPADYRAGADVAHAHALPELWADATDGVIHHHPDRTAVAHHHAADWLDPAVTASASFFPLSQELDAGEQRESVPATTGVDILLATVAIVSFGAVRGGPLPGRERLPVSHSPHVLIPPPRWTLAAG
jgi:hypothetical protein